MSNTHLESKLKVITPSKKLLRLIFISAVTALGGFIFAYDAVIISGTLSLFKTQFELSSVQEGLFVNSALIGTALGTFFSGKMSDIYGRKSVLYQGGILIVLSVIGCVVLNTYFDIWTARFIGGFGAGMTTMVCPLYIAEVMPKKIRGAMVTILQLSMTLGGLTATLVNANVYKYSLRLEPVHSDYLFLSSDFINKILIDEQWRTMFGSELIFALIFIPLIALIPESPRWLLSKNRKEEAQTILQSLLNKNEAETQIVEIEGLLKAKDTSRFSDLMKPGLKKALYLAMFFCFISEVSGITAIVYYGPTILENAGFSYGGSLGSAIYLFLTNLVGCSLAVLFVDKLGRRPLMLAGVIGAIVALAASGIMLQFNVQGIPVVIAICGYVFCYSFAMGPLKLVFASEVFPTRLRGLAVSLSMSVIWFTGIVINQLFPVVRDAYSIDVIFYAFAFFLIPSIYVVIKHMPETKGRSLEEIERMLLSQTANG